MCTVPDGVAVWGCGVSGIERWVVVDASVGPKESMRFMDAGGGGACEAVLVPDPVWLRLVLEVEVERDPVRGWLQGPDGTRERFEGLLGLLAALDAARATDCRGADTTDAGVGNG
jgi:hypothetical protein